VLCYSLKKIKKFPGEELFNLFGALQILPTIIVVLFSFQSIIGAFWHGLLKR
jgi:hypothetical protein